jgi:hypothetical protein
MARSKGTPERSKLVRSQTAAFSRKQRTEGGDEPGAKPDKEKPETAEAKAEPEPGKRDKGDKSDKSDKAIPEPSSAAETQPVLMRRPDPKDLPEIEPPEPKAEPWPDATPRPMKPVEPGEGVRQRQATVAMPTVADLGRPPEMPRTAAPPPLALGSVEDPTHMPGPREIPSGNPDDPAPAPGRVPPGDSRSLRRDNEFALVYRVGTCVITRTGTLGTRGQWRVVEYPTSAAASSSYAKECSRFVSEGFSDYRE